MSNHASIAIDSIHLYTVGNEVRVEVEINGKAYRVITEYLDIHESLCDHTVHASGLWTAVMRSEEPTP